MDLLDVDLVTNGNVAYSIFMTIVFVLMISVNVLLLIIFIRNPVLISPPQLLYINLACSNITLALFSVTFSVVTLNSGKWIFPDLVCHFVGFFNTCSIHITMFTAFSTLNERYQQRLNHRLHAQTFTTRGIALRIGVYWGVSLAVSVLPFIPGLGTYSFSPNLGTCWSPPNFLGLIPTITNSIYLTLWVYTAFNLLILPKVSLPEALKHKRSKKPGFLPQLLTSGIYTLTAVIFILTVTLQKTQAVSPPVSSALERTSLILIYSSMFLLPVCLVAFNGNLRMALRDIILRKPTDSSKYEQINQNVPQHRPPPSAAETAFNKSGPPLHGQVIYPDSTHMSLPPPHHRGYPRHVQYTRPLRHPDQPPPSSRACPVQRSHSSVGAYHHYRAGYSLHPGQRSLSLSRVADHHHHQLQGGVKKVIVTPTTTPRSEPGSSTSETKVGTASSAASSSTVADIVDL